MQPCTASVLVGGWHSAGRRLPRLSGSGEVSGGMGRGKENAIQGGKRTGRRHTRGDGAG